MFGHDQVGKAIHHNILHRNQGLRFNDESGLGFREEENGLFRWRKRVSGSLYRRRVELLEAELANELVALDVEAGECFGFNEVATSVWRMLATPMRRSEIEEALLGEYEVDREQCRTELGQLLDDMIAKRLIAIC